MKKKDLSNIAFKSELDHSNTRIGIVTSDWNAEITDALTEGAAEYLGSVGVKTKNIIQTKVPGSFELALGAQYLIEKKSVDAVICNGCVIQGETKHFDFISQAVANGIQDLNIKHSLPVIFGVLTTDNFEQAKERAGGKHGNKGVEAAVTAIQMLELSRKLL